MGLLMQVWWSDYSYNTYNSHYKEVECFQQQIEDLLYKYGVDFAFFGHVHAYERTNRQYKYVNDPCGTVHITIGDGGNIEGVSHCLQASDCMKQIFRRAYLLALCQRALPTKNTTSSFTNSSASTLEESL
jgi:hypothetical protein